MKRNPHHIILLVLFTYMASVAQNRTLLQANQLYAQKAYSDAIPLYEKIIKTDSSGGNNHILSKLGDCYRLTNNVSGQLLCYGNLVEKGAAEPIQELYYGEALVQNGEAEKAKSYFEKYSADERGHNRASSLNKILSYTRNSDAYMIHFAGFNSPQNDFCAVKFRDEIVFASTRGGNEFIKQKQGWTDGNYLSLYVSGLNDNGEEIPVKKFMNNLNSKFNNGPVCFNQDFTKVFFTRNNSAKEDMAKDSTYKLSIYEAGLEQTGFGMMQKLPFANKDYNFAHPSVTPDGYTLYFASDMEGGKGGMDIYVTHKDSSGVWSVPENLGDKVNTTGNEVFPFIASNNVLYFSSNGHDGLGGLDIYQAPMKEEGQIHRVYNLGEPVNSILDDFGIFLNEDNKTGYISSNRKNGGMDDDIYNLLILREVKHDKDVMIVVKDRITDTPMPNTKFLMNADTVVTNEKGEYSTTAEEGATFKFITLREDYFTTEDSLVMGNSLNESFTKEIVMERKPMPFLQGLITDAANGNPLDGVSIRVTDIISGESFNPYITSSSGSYYNLLPDKKIGDKLTYLIRIDKPGYLQRSIIFTHDVASAGEINMNEKMSLTLGRVEVGMDLAKMIDIKPIYFDIGKSDIRRDAATELDKIVQVMNEYPNMSIELGSHTDCRSGAEANLKLSSARAKSSMEYIIKRGINKNRITAKGYGESKLLNNCACEGAEQSNCTEEEHAQNRRTEFVITNLQ